jgi:hypothetical protein
VPALLIAQSKRPWASRVPATSASTSSSRETSTDENSIRPPDARIFSVAASPASASTSQPTTVAPAFANASARTAPQPRAVPVIKTTLSANDGTARPYRPDPITSTHQPARRTPALA